MKAERSWGEATEQDSSSRPFTFLLFSNTFPPRGGSSVQRVAKFAKYAHRLGAWPIVLTTRFVGGLLDHSLSEELPADLEVHRVSKALLGDSGLLARLRRRLPRLPDEHGPWRRAAPKAAVRLAKERAVDAIFISCGPPSTMIAGIRSARRTGLPAVLDIRDFRRKNAITGRSLAVKRPVQEFLMKFIEPWAFSHVSRFTVVSNTYKQILQDYYGVADDKITVIYSGYDPEDFAQPLDATLRSDLPVLRYIGFIRPAKSLANFLAALKLCNEKRLANGEQPILFEIYGGNDQSMLTRAFAEAEVEQWCKCHGYISHDRAVMLMRTAAGLVLMPSGEPGVVPGKFCEYVGARRPILLVDNDNYELKEIVTEQGLGAVAAWSDVGAIAGALEDMLKQPFQPDDKSLELFRRDLQAQAFLDVMKAACAEADMVTSR